ELVDLVVTGHAAAGELQHGLHGGGFERPDALVPLRQVDPAEPRLAHRPVPAPAAAGGEGLAALRLRAPARVSQRDHFGQGRLTTSMPRTAPGPCGAGSRTPLAPTAPPGPA